MARRDDHAGGTRAALGMKRLIAFALLLSACNAAAAPTSTPSPASTAFRYYIPSDNPATIHVQNTLASAASAKVKLAAGTYAASWDASDGSDEGCAFYLFLTTKVDGPTIAEIASALFPDSSGHAGSATISIAKAGTYIVQEDESGLASCDRLWSAELTHQ